MVLMIYHRSHFSIFSASVLSSYFPFFCIFLYSAVLICMYVYVSANDLSNELHIYTIQGDPESEPLYAVYPCDVK